MAAGPLRGIALQFSEAGRAAARVAATTSLGEASAAAYALELYASETVLAALRASTASAARHASVLFVACAPANRSTTIALRAAYGLFAGEESCLTSASAATDRAAASTTAAPSRSAPSASLLLALNATDWARSSLAMSPAATSAQSELGDPISLTTAAAAAAVTRDEGSSGFNLSAAQARTAAHLFPFGPLVLSSSTSSAPSSFTGSTSSTAESATPGKVDMLHGCTSEEELNNNPVLARVETKVDGTIRRLDKHTVDLENLSKFMHNEKRKRTLSRVVAFIWKIFGVS